MVFGHKRLKKKLQPEKSLMLLSVGVEFGVSFSAIAIRVQV
jgi:hypothetical protein